MLRPARAPRWALLLSCIFTALACSPAGPTDDGGMAADAHEHDAGDALADAGHATDAGTTLVDAGSTDAGATDAGMAPDAGDTPVDAGDIADAGNADAGTRVGVGPGAPGPYATTSFTSSLMVSDMSGREVALTIYRPVGQGAFPTVVLLHGFQLSPDLYASYGAHLASHGYLAVLPGMPGGVLGPIGAPTHQELAGYLSEVLDWLTAHSNAGNMLEGDVDLEQIALAGHSLGGKISLLLAASDSRVKGVFAIDPVDTPGGPGATPSPANPSVTPELMGQITVPIVLVGETVNATCTGFFCQPCAPEADNFQRYFEHAAGAALEVDVMGANHVSFLDNPQCGFACSACGAGTDDPAATRALTQRTMIAFFDFLLRGDDDARTWLTGEGIGADVTAGRVVVQSKNAF